MVKFLVIRFSSIGDIVLTTPVLRGLNKQLKDAEIHFLTKPDFEKLLMYNPYISKIYTLKNNSDSIIPNLKEEAYDYIIDLQNNLQSNNIKRALRKMYFTVNKVNVKKWLYVNFKIDRLPDLHIVDRYMKTVELFDVKNDNAGLDFFINKEEEIDIDTLPSEFSEGFISFVIGAKHHTKKLPVEQIIKTVSYLTKPLILIGGSEDKADGDIVCTSLPGNTIFNGCGKWNINQSASIIKQSNCIITNDTGMMHIAAAFRKKIITIWGNTTPRFGMYPYLPSKESVNFEVKGLPCRPCSKLGKKQCPKKHFKCMMDHDPVEIANTANRLF